MRRMLATLSFSLIAGVALINPVSTYAQQRNPALGDGGSLNSPPGANSTQVPYSGFGMGSYGGYSNWAPPAFNTPGYSPNYNNYFSANQYGNYGSNYSGYGNGYSGYGHGAYGYGSAYQNQNPYYNAYGYSSYGFGGFGTAPNLYYGFSDPSFGNGGYDRSSFEYFQQGSPFSRF